MFTHSRNVKQLNKTFKNVKKNNKFENLPKKKKKKKLKLDTNRRITHQTHEKSEKRVSKLAY